MKILKHIFVILILVLVFSTRGAEASNSVGTIDASFKLTKICQDETCTSYGNVNWKPTINAMTPGALPVTITDTSITGHIWGDQLGWINLAPTGAGIFVNPNTGVITGKAFATGGSWINFNPTSQGVSLVDNGSGSNFSGWAWVSGPYGGWMQFDCGGVGTCIKTDWRTVPNRPVASSGGGGGLMNIYAPTVTPPVIIQKQDQDQNTIKEAPSKVVSGLKPQSFTTFNTFDANEDGEPDILPPQKDQMYQGVSVAVVEYKKIFTFAHTEYVPKKPCSLCVIATREQGVDPLVKTNASQNIIIKFGFVPKKFELALPISRTVDTTKNPPVQTKSLDMTSTFLALIAVWGIRKVAAARLLTGGGL